jgi:hypothetical protein
MLVHSDCHRAASTGVAASVTSPQISAERFDPVKIPTACSAPTDFRSIRRRGSVGVSHTELEARIELRS